MDSASSLPPLTPPPLYVAPAILQRANEDTVAAPARWPRVIAGLMFVGCAITLSAGIVALLTDASASGIVANLAAGAQPSGVLRSFSAWTGSAALLGALCGALGLVAAGGINLRAAWSPQLARRWCVLSLAWLALDFGLALAAQREAVQFWRDTTRMTRGTSVAPDELPPFQRELLFEGQWSIRSLAKLALVSIAFAAIPLITLGWLSRDQVREESRRWAAPGP